jgi:hypothetical protein
MMSITGAVAELNQEIERLTKIRDSLLQGTPGQDAARTHAGAVPAAPAKKAAPRTKRVLSAAGRKKISEASKARWAAVKKAKSAAQKATASK